MKSISLIKLTCNKYKKQQVRDLLASRHYNADEVVDRNVAHLACLSGTSLHKLDEKVKLNNGLPFEDAFRGCCYTLAATNRSLYRVLRKRLKKAADGGSFTITHALTSGIAFMQLMAMKEALSSLTEAEIAGLSAASLMDVIIRFELGEEVAETSGMGGDRGFGGDDKTKSINASTLSAIVLSSLGVPTVKHGSYGNTSPHGSTNTIEGFGANVNTASVEEVHEIWKKVGFLFFDAHWCKTIHDLSHLLRIETVNHIVGPMTPPISAKTRIHKLIGVNHNVHPETIVKAYNILHLKGFQKIGGIVAITGLNSESEPFTNPADTVSVKKLSVLDEVSPFASVVSIGWEGTFCGTDLIRPSDFGVTISLADILLVKKEKTQQFNYDALTGSNSALADYLAMNSALALFSARYANRSDAVVSGKISRKYLKECFSICREAIHSGKAERKLVEYVQATGGQLATC